LNEHYASQVAISREIIEERPDYVEYMLKRVRDEGAIKVFDEIYKAGAPVVVETHLESWDDPATWTKKYALHYRLTAVRTRNFVMPTFEFINHEGIREWKCAACGMVNIIDASFCGEKHKNAAGCGRPRDFARSQ
jgi:hypothetical protein